MMWVERFAFALALVLGLLLLSYEPPSARAAIPSLTGLTAEDCRTLEAIECFNKLGLSLNSGDAYREAETACERDDARACLAVGAADESGQYGLASRDHALDRYLRACGLDPK